MITISISKKRTQTQNLVFLTKSYHKLFFIFHFALKVTDATIYEVQQQPQKS